MRTLWYVQGEKGVTYRLLLTHNLHKGEHSRTIQGPSSSNKKKQMHSPSGHLLLRQSYMRGFYKGVRSGIIHSGDTLGNNLVVQQQRNG